MKKKLTAKDIEYLQIMAQEPISLESKVISEDSESELEFGDFIKDPAPTPEEVAMVKETQRILREYIKKILSPREELVITMRYGIDNNIPMTLEQIGENFGVTRERIRQIEKQAIRKLRIGLERNNMSLEDLL